MPLILAMKALLILIISTSTLAACATGALLPSEVRQLPDAPLTDDPDMREEVEAARAATAGCTKLQHIFSGVGADQVAARADIRAKIAQAGGNAVQFVSGWVELDPDTPEDERYGETALGYLCGESRN